MAIPANPKFGLVWNWLRRLANCGAKSFGREQPGRLAGTGQGFADRRPGLGDRRKHLHNAGEQDLHRRVEQQVDLFVAAVHARFHRRAPAGRVGRLLARPLLEPVQRLVVVGLYPGRQAGLGDGLKGRLQEEPILLVGPLAALLAPFQQSLNTSRSGRFVEKAPVRYALGPSS